MISFRILAGSWLWPLERGGSLLACLLVSGMLSSVLIVILMPLLRRYALARPNARSSHAVPTPQGGGIAVILAAFLAAAAALAGPRTLGMSGPGFGLFAIMPACLVLAGLGAADDIHPLPVGPRLMIQLLCVLLVVAPVAGENRLFPIPVWIETGILLFAGLWFVNLVNFMDGLDWITVAQMVPVAGFIAGAGMFHAVSLNAPAVILAASLCGALLGFAPFNKPVARLFLGDVGSLPIGLLTGWLLLELARAGGLAAAILLPLYSLMDASLTLLLRLSRRERIWEAHRSHFYQRATANGRTALSVSVHVFGLNMILMGLALITLIWPTRPVQIVSILSGTILTGLLLARFARPLGARAA